MRPIGEYEAALHRGYRDLAARAKSDPAAAVQFKESHLRIDSDPVEAIAILRVHPLLQVGVESSGTDEGVRLRLLGRRLRVRLRDLVASLAKLSVKEGGEEAAQRLNGYLAAGASGTLPAHEIIVIHGLAISSPLNLSAGAYIASYEDARAEFDLPENPEAASGTIPDAAALVRSLAYGPGIVPLDEHAPLPDMQATYRFPDDYRVDFEGWGDHKLLIDLLSIAMRVPLLSRTRYTRVADWVVDIDPNFAFGTHESTGFVSDVWPSPAQELSGADVDAFLTLARGWRRYPPDRVGAVNLAIRRVAGSFSRPGGRFGQEDRILDVAIALEVLYGGSTGHKLARRAAALIGATAGEQKKSYDHARSFYDVRSSIVHWKEPPVSRDAIDEQVQLGRELACRTLTRLLDHGKPPKWAEVMRGLLPETQAYIEKAKRQGKK